MAQECAATERSVSKAWQNHRPRGATGIEIHDHEKLTAAEEAFERGRRTVGLCLGPILAAAILAAPIGVLTPPQQALSAVLVLCVTFWLTEAIPLPATGLLGPALAVLLGVGPAREVFAPFGDPLLFLFVGSFLIAEAMAHHGLDRRLAAVILARRFVSKSPARILVALGVTSAAISMWISNTATTAMMLPVALGVLRILRGAPAKDRTGMAGATRAAGGGEPAALPGADGARWPYAAGLILCISFSASIGGIGTPVGTPPNLIGMGMIGRLAGRQIGFLEWTTFAVPTLLLVLPLMLGVLLLLHPAGRSAFTGASEFFRAEHRRLGRMGRGEIAVAISFLVAISLWVLPGVVSLILGPESPAARVVQERLPEGPVALLAAALLFVFPVDWKERRFACDWRLAARIDWGTIMLFGGGMALGSLMFSTGLAQKIGAQMVGMQGGWSPGAFLAVAIVAAVLVSEATSNTASASMVVPVVIAIAKQQGLDPVLPAVGACLGASFGFALPVSTAPNAMAYGTGLVPILKMLRAGLLLDLIGAAGIWVMLMLLGPGR